MLFKLYGGAANDILQFSLEDGLEMCKVTFEKYNEDMLRQRWLLHYESKMSFADFKERLISDFKNKTATEKDNIELLTNLQSIFG